MCVSVCADLLLDLLADLDEVLGQQHTRVRLGTGLQHLDVSQVHRALRLDGQVKRLHNHTNRIQLSDPSPKEDKRADA